MNSLKLWIGRVPSIVGVAFFFILWGCGGASAPAEVRQIPDFTAKDAQGREVSLSEFLGRDVVLISFWGSNCEPCRREMAFFVELHKRYSAQGLVILSIAIDEPETMGDAISEARLRGYPFRVLFDEGGGATGRLNPRRSMPFSLLIDRRGQKVFERVGFVPGDAAHIEEAVMKVLTETGGT